MIVTSTDTVPDREVTAILGIVKGNSVRARNIGDDLIQGVQSMLGGELRSYSRLVSEARDEALERMQDEARDRNADAVLTVRLETSEIAQGAAELLAYGTAVKLD